MTRTDMHLEAMLRHLGATQYGSPQDTASAADSTCAPDAAGPTTLDRPTQSRPHRWARHVRDVMTTAVVTVDRVTPYKEVARLMADNGVSGFPVLDPEDHVVGVVTEANLLAEEEKRAWERMAIPGHGLRPQQQWALTAGELMSSPAITIRPDATIASAARAMNENRVRRLPVVGSDGRLLGIVSRRDLLRVFLRPDSVVGAEVREVFDEVLRAESGTITVTVRDGVVVITGPRDGDGSLAAVAIRLAWAVDGVVDVVDRRGNPGGGTGTARASQAPGTSESSREM
ncbi:MAG TPA: CBS domain-containing protein [Trebonia sp.]|nr:CBS domain-containing protein [Trebonia sp.]